MTRFDGGENATRSSVVRYLMDNYLEEGASITARRARALVDKHPRVVETGEQILSNAAYVGDKIADAELLDYIPQADEPDDDEEDEYGYEHEFTITMKVNVTSAFDMTDPFVRMRIFREITAALKRQPVRSQTQDGSFTATIGVVTSSS